MSEKSYRDAIREAMMEEMDRDPNVLIMGEDIGVYEGTFRIT
ncbi:MAG TPA: alpha-ketoacid dehydrogenase subunit beta, partial [Thermoanaerobaculia bacterium]|nr:alpha-ketoacid dehydrogenase subunit beta [Thermoanaerobaculia bacterium]